MEDKNERVYQGLSHAAWGYFFLHFDFNLGPVSILPRFVGWLLLLAAINALSEERRELLLLRSLAILEAIWSGADWLFSWTGGSAEGHILFLDLLLEAATIYFHFQFLTDLAALAEGYQRSNDTLACRLRRRRTAYILLLTAISLAGALRELLPWEGWEWGMVGAAVVGCVIAVMLMANLFELRRCFRDKDGDREQDETAFPKDL